MKLALLGCGVVGSSLVRLLDRDATLLERRLGEPLELAAIVVRDPSRPRDPWVPAHLLTSDLERAITDSSVDVVVEVMGSPPVALVALEQALRHGKSVVTANKDVIADHLDTLEALAEANRVDLLFEAAVAGGVPLIRVLRTSLFGERLWSVQGIVNGTSNYVLTRMAEEGIELGAAVEEAIRLGYAEADPTRDLDGADAAAKAAILASLAFECSVRADDVRTEGVLGVSAADMHFAAANHRVIKLIASARRVQQPGGEALCVEVFPAMVPREHPLAGVRDAANAIFVEGQAVGELLFMGPGAGGLPTAAAVLADILEAAQNRRAGRFAVGVGRERPRFLDAGWVVGRFALSLVVRDAAGVLARVAEVFGDEGVSIAQVEQLAAGEGEAHLMLVTHETTLSALVAVEQRLAKLGDVVRRDQRYRVL